MASIRRDAPETVTGCFVRPAMPPEDATEASRKRADDPASWKRDEETGRQQVFRIRPRSCKEGRRRTPGLLTRPRSPRWLCCGTCGV